LAVAKAFSAAILPLDASLPLPFGPKLAASSLKSLALANSPWFYSSIPELSTGIFLIGR